MAATTSRTASSIRRAWCNTKPATASRTPRAFFSLFGFYSEITDLIARRPATYNGADTIGTDAVHRNENVGEAFIYGGEFSGRVELIRDFMNVGGTASYTLGQNTTDDEPLRRIPPPLGNGYVRFGEFPFWIEGAFEAAAKQDRLAQGDKDDARIGPDGTPAFTVYHLRMGLFAGDFVEAVLAAENLGDVLYKYHGSGLYEAGRSYKAQVRLTF
ncbi:MAG: TonB-dependent receptor [Deltaproteobacteria bacterium]|nr:TonB-dependent receptor [Deltaproteobacteria bacterium]